MKEGTSSSEELAGPTQATEWARKLGLLFWGFVMLIAFKKTYDIALLKGVEEGQDRWLELIRAVFVALTWTIVVAAYVVRKPPKVLAQGFAERYYPLVFVFVSFGIFEFKTPPPPFQLYAIGVSLCILGFAFTAWSYWHLRHHFSILAEVRGLVSSGPYRFVRHPVYLGQYINWVGIAILFEGWQIWAFVFLLMGMQAVRAKIEERKLHAELGELYGEFAESRGFILPGFGKFQRRENPG